MTRNPDSYILPRINDTLDALAGFKYLCTLDMIQRYHQVMMDKESKHETAFHAPYYNPQWMDNYVPFGLMNSPRTFKRLKDKIIQGLEYGTALYYIDNVIVFEKTVQETMNRFMVILTDDVLQT